MKLTGQFEPGMPVWCCIERGSFVAGIVERVGHTKLTVLTAAGELIKVGPTFIAARRPNLNGRDNPATLGGKRGVA